MKKLWHACAFLLLIRSAGAADGAASSGVPILAYHRLGAEVADSMTVKTPVFESHLKYLKDHGYTIIPLKRLVAYIAGESPAPPPGSVVITADDGHSSIYNDMFPLIKRYRVPVTLFVYPSALSNAKYACLAIRLVRRRTARLRCGTRTTNTAGMA